MTTEQDGGKVVSLTHRPPLTPGNVLLSYKLNLLRGLHTFAKIQQFLKPVTTEQFMLLREPQHNRCLVFTDRRVVMSSRVFFQLGKETTIRRRQLGAVGRVVFPECEIRLWKVCSCYRTGLISNALLLKVILRVIRAKKLLVLTVRSSADWCITTLVPSYVWACYWKCSVVQGLREDFMVKCDSRSEYCVALCNVWF